VNPDLLTSQLRASREHLTRITAGLDGTRLLGPKLAIVNPPLWELGHIAWSQEYWCLRRRGENVAADCLVRGGDALYDSAKVAHATRWDLPLPGLEATLSYQAEVLERVLQRLDREPENRELHYFAQLAVFHEDMHAEAFHYTRQTLGYEDPFGGGPGERTPSTIHHPPSTVPSGDVELAGGAFQLGASPDGKFVFDNEKWAHEVTIAPFRIARAPVTNAQYLEFVKADGYSRREWWSDEGWTWKSGEGRQAPKYWTRHDDAWMQRRFDRVLPLEPHHPVIHVNWHEAQAYCRYAGRRLPTEAEWEYAASWDRCTQRKLAYPWGAEAPVAGHANLEGAGRVDVGSFAGGDAASGCRQMIGNVWEWTESTFAPYPGFVVDPYKEYSEPWFGTHKVLRGGSFATTRRLIRNTWRNFYTPDRYDVFVGFRTCAEST
jgi:iron(II)-dependent oxidoreductase